LSPTIAFQTLKQNSNLKQALTETARLQTYPTISTKIPPQKANRARPNVKVKANVNKQPHKITASAKSPTNLVARLNVPWFLVLDGNVYNVIFYLLRARS
jgi:hypothetical protein